MAAQSICATHRLLINICHRNVIIPRRHRLWPSANDSEGRSQVPERHSPGLCVAIHVQLRLPADRLRVQNVQGRQPMDGGVAALRRNTMRAAASAQELECRIFRQRPLDQRVVQSGLHGPVSLRDGPHRARPEFANVRARRKLERRAADLCVRRLRLAIRHCARPLVADHEHDLLRLDR